MQEQPSRNLAPTRAARRPNWLGRLVLALSGLNYALALTIARVILGSVEFRELMSTLERP